MAMQKRYSDILADILKKKYSNCTCPTYLSRLKIDKPKFNTGECQFGPNCEFPTICSYNQEKCTCYSQCTCVPSIPEFQQLISPKDIPAKNIYPLQKAPCTEPNCICVGTCLCKSDDSLLVKMKYQPPSHCNTANCICSICLCRPDHLGPGSLRGNFLPSYFRNTIINEAKLLREKTQFFNETKLKTDQMIEQECAEIKQLLVEHEENKKKELNQSRPQTVNERETKKIPEKISVEKEAKKTVLQKSVSINEEGRDSSKTIDSQTKSDRKSSMQPSLPAPDGSIRKLESSEKYSKIENKKKERGRRKEKTSKRKLGKHVRSSRTKLKTTYSHKSSVKMRPLRIRYYYSGETEHYGVKLGHRHCLDKKGLVPKNMGWLWNIEDPTKGIRERKGWPPGFIGKSIKNMIRGKKRFEDVDSGDKQMEARDRWKPGKGMVEENVEPKEELPLLHIVKKGRTYNITFCPKDSDEDVGPIPIPFTITEKKRDSDTDSSDSTLEFELHSPKPRRKPNVTQVVHMEEPTIAPPQIDASTTVPTTTAPPSIMKQAKKKPTKMKSRGSEENKILWEEQLTQIQKIG